MPEGPATIFPGGGETRSPPRFQLSSFVQGKIAYRTQPNDRKYEKKSCRSLFHRDIKTTNVSIPARFHEISFLSLHFILRKKKKRKTTVSLFRSNIASEVVERGEGSLVTRSVIIREAFSVHKPGSEKAERERRRGKNRGWVFKKRGRCLPRPKWSRVASISRPRGYVRPLDPRLGARGKVHARGAKKAVRV